MDSPPKIHNTDGCKYFETRWNDSSKTTYGIYCILKDSNPKFGKANAENFSKSNSGKTGKALETAMNVRCKQLLMGDHGNVTLWDYCIKKFNNIL